MYLPQIYYVSEHDFLSLIKKFIIKELFLP